MVLDGAFFASSALALRGVDLVGSTYYNTLPQASLGADLIAMEAIANDPNGTSPKGFIVKEFGLVSGLVPNRSLACEQNDEWLRSMVGLCASSRACVGSLIWSLRFHAEGGGFHWHREAGGDIMV